MNDEELKYLPHLTAALRLKGFPADAITLVLDSPWTPFVVGDAWRNHVPYELSQGWFGRRWLTGPMRCLWLWLPNMELDKLPQDVSVRAEETMKRRKPQESSAPVSTEFTPHRKSSR